MTLQADLYAHLEARGYRGRMVAIEHLPELYRAITDLRDQRLLDETFYQDRLSWLHQQLPEELPDARALIVLSRPDPRTDFIFHWKGERRVFSVPPAYQNWREKLDHGQQALAEALEPAGWRVAPLNVPKKRLAVCSGLAAYGKNNVTYVEGWGSYHNLTTFCTDMPCEVDEWRAPVTMARCETCQACARACPTGAIGSDRFLLHGERCITYHNENGFEVPFPAWIDPAWHTSLVGCMHCQTACPENRSAGLGVALGGEFDEAETRRLVEYAPGVELPGELVEKLRQADMLDAMDALPRNLSALLG
ncbi:MAG TPA: 4Fe-4S double cluster binding domain-containing protein [Anaerolineaceae bacterium]|nr:4Fe-4S double cluster binding domain-containing protein [Anaerolineaceae bacterium]